MKQESWQAVTPQFDKFSTSIDNYSNQNPIELLDIQPRLKAAISQFSLSNGVTRVLLVNGQDNPFHNALLTEAFSEFTDKPFKLCESLTMADVLGSYKADEHGTVVTQTEGLLSQVQNGFLCVSANLLLANPVTWLTLKSALFGHAVEPINVNPKLPAKESSLQSYNFKLIVLGNREQLADLDFQDQDIHSGLCMFSEYEPELALNDESIGLYLGYIQWLTAKYQLPNLTPSAIKRLMVAGARLTEDQGYMPLDTLWYLALIQEAALNSSSKNGSSNSIDGPHIDKALDERYYRSSYLPERALSDIFDGQVIIETQGEQIGQVNGLTVIDVPGHPLAYGEPARISCVIHFGDGDISDVERKAELGGNLHAKGMMIMQAFVSSALNLDEPLPYSASVVFEQSYSEVDGDSASLAELCSFVSALSEYPINQQIAVTGAVDQFGRVQAVGGLNEKIEGFYHVCKHQGLTGHQGVILPTSNLKHLALSKDVVESIKNNEFHIWSVSHVDEAIPILMGQEFRSEDENSVISKIAARIENYERHEHPPSLFQRLREWIS